MNKRQKKKHAKKRVEEMCGVPFETIKAWVTEIKSKPYDHAWASFCNDKGRCPCPDENCGYKVTEPPF